MTGKSAGLDQAVVAELRSVALGRETNFQSASGLTAPIPMVADRSAVTLAVSARKCWCVQC